MAVAEVRDLKEVLRVFWPDDVGDDIEVLYIDTLGRPQSLRCGTAADAKPRVTPGF